MKSRKTFILFHFIIGSRKGNNITLKKIDCISAVNTLPGDPLNFPDLDISNLLLMSTEKGGRNSDISLSIAMNPEIGRKSMISTFGTPFSTSSSSNALQGSDFASALYDSDLAYSLNDHDIMHAPEYSLNSNEHFPFRPKNIMSDNMEFQVPNQVEKRRISRIRRIKNALMDMELMLGKDDLFINESEMLNYATKNLISEEADPIKEALNLLNCPDEPFVMETFDGIFKTSKLNFSYSKPMISKKSGSNNSAFTSDHIDFHDAEGHYEYYNNNDNFNEIEQYRNVPNSTPNTLNLPWSISGSGLSSSSMGLSSIGINTPIRKGQLNGQNSPTSLLDLQLSSTSSSSSISLYNPKNDMNLPQETFDFLYYLHDSMSSDSGINTLGRILNKETVSRPVVARAFHHLLELKSANLIDVKQSSPFSDIQIIMN